MLEIPDLEMINQGTVEVKGVVFPVVDIQVIASDDSDRSKLEFEWETTEMTQTSVTFLLRFKDAIYVSTNEEPDYLRVIFRDPYMFVSK